MYFDTHLSTSQYSKRRCIGAISIMYVVQSEMANDFMVNVNAVHTMNERECMIMDGTNGPIVDRSNISKFRISAKFR